MKYQNLLYIFFSVLFIFSCKISETEDCPYKLLGNKTTVSKNELMAEVDNVLSFSVGFDVKFPVVNLDSSTISLADTAEIKALISELVEEEIKYSQKELEDRNRFKDALCGIYASLSDDKISKTQKTELQQKYVDAQKEFLEFEFSSLKKGFTAQINPVPLFINYQDSLKSLKSQVKTTIEKLQNKILGNNNKTKNRKADEAKKYKDENAHSEWTKEQIIYLSKKLDDIPIDSSHVFYQNFYTTQKKEYTNLLDTLVKYKISL